MNNANADLSVEEARRRIQKLTRRSFLTGGIAAAVGASGLAWTNWLAPKVDEIPWPLRRVLQGNESLASAWFSPERLAPEFSASLAANPRPNGRIGLSAELDPSQWSLTVQQPERQAQTLDMAAIRALPRFESTTELKCIEGWSQVVTWGGARLSDLVAAHGLAKRGTAALRYAQLLTPDESYYVGLDMPSALHPQTMLCYEMNGAPLEAIHGAPLRLVIPVKYGVKNLKCIGQIRFLDERPADYWAERGYDWYAGL